MVHKPLGLVCGKNLDEFGGEGKGSPRILWAVAAIRNVGRQGSTYEDLEEMMKLSRMVLEVTHAMFWWTGCVPLVFWKLKWGCIESHGAASSMRSTQALAGLTAHCCYWGLEWEFKQKVDQKKVKKQNKNKNQTKNPKTWFGKKRSVHLATSHRQRECGRCDCKCSGVLVTL